MRRITISVEDSLADQFDDLIQRHGYENRSEAFRDLVRARIESERKASHKAVHCVAAVSFLYSHQERDLASRIAALQHAQHDLCVSKMQVQLDHSTCLETLFLRGPFKEVGAFADALVAQSGVRHGNVHIVPVELEAPSKKQHSHVHLSPLS
jgi:CopG family nickel-responsive transcriptional regulator